MLRQQVCDGSLCFDGVILPIDILGSDWHFFWVIFAYRSTCLETVFLKGPAERCQQHFPMNSLLVISTVPEITANKKEVAPGEGRQMQIMMF